MDALEREVLNYYDQLEKEAADKLSSLLALPSIPSDGLWSDGECFDPWEMFPCLYGSYSSAFDDLAIEVLENLQDQKFECDDLAAEMFREILCTSGLCEYGTSPRVCFPTSAFKALLPQLIERWSEYAKIQWKR